VAEPAEMVVPLLREIRAEINARFDRVDTRFDIVERRLQKLEETQVSYRQALSAEALEKKVKDPETLK
jgi:hypothetical protein